MHRFCCFSRVSDLSPVSKPTRLLKDVAMSHTDIAATESSSTAVDRSDPSHHVGGVDHVRVSQRTRSIESMPQLPSMREATQFLEIMGHGELKINDIVGNGVSGKLYKWVNYGRGWRSRWFVLQDGVLSYYKIHGPDKIVVSQETERGCKVIGEESFRRMSQSNRNGNAQTRRKPCGEIHLKVSSIRESRSDDKRFSIYSGTKRLHLRAETNEDRAAWMEALQAVKDMFPRMSNSELMASVDNVTISTEKLRQRLLAEGVSEAAIRDSEQIVKNEFAALQNQLVLLKQKHWLLIDTLRQLEVHVMVARVQHDTSFWTSVFPSA